MYCHHDKRHNAAQTFMPLLEELTGKRVCHGEKQAVLLGLLGPSIRRRRRLVFSLPEAATRASFSLPAHEILMRCDVAVQLCLRIPCSPPPWSPTTLAPWPEEHRGSTTPASAGLQPSNNSAGIESTVRRRSEIFLSTTFGVTSLRRLRQHQGNSAGTSASTMSPLSASPSHHGLAGQWRHDKPVTPRPLAVGHVCTLARLP
jgi:hypothetical protein